MKRSLLFLLCLTILNCLMITQAQAHYVYLEPSLQIPANVGERVTVAAYLYATESDIIYGWGLSQTFDTTELSRYSYAWGSSELGSFGSVMYSSPVTKENYTYYARYDYQVNDEGDFIGFALTSGTKYELFKVTYTFNGGAFDGEDVWIQWPSGPPYSPDVFFDFDSDYVRTLPIQGTGPDYGSNAVPIPGAVWLLGSGLVALVGLKRRTSL